MISEEGWNRASQQALSRKPECGWAHSLPVKSGGLCGSKPCFLPGNLSIKQSSKFPSSSDSPDTLGRHPWWCEEQRCPWSKQGSLVPLSVPTTSTARPVHLPSRSLCLCRNALLRVFILCLYHFVAIFTNAQTFCFKKNNTDLNIEWTFHFKGKKISVTCILESMVLEADADAVNFLLFAL